MARPAIRFDGLVKSYGDDRAPDGIECAVPRGEIFGFLGPNGAGKTTAIRILIDLIRPTAGRAEALGFDECREIGTGRSPPSALLGREDVVAPGVAPETAARAG